MKEIRAFVREDRAGNVAVGLTNAGFDFSVLDVRRVVHGLDRARYDYSVALGGEYEKTVRFEIVCADDVVERIVAIVEQAAHTGRHGDGMIFVAGIEEALRISTGERGDDALRDRP